MVDAPKSPPPAPRPNPLHGTQQPADPKLGRDVSLPHVPPKPEGEQVKEGETQITENTAAEQEAGKAAVEQNEKRIDAEQSAGAKASGQSPKRT